MRLVALLVVVLASPAAAQTGASKPWTATTPDGKPDLQGVWTNATLTPLERPARFAGRAVMTEAEAAELESQAVTSFEQQAADRAQAAAAPRAGAAVGSYNQAVWADPDRKVVATRQTSLVVDPPDGRVPLRPEAERQRSTRAAQETDSYEFMNPFDRCITRGVPGGLFPAGYNNAYQILQTPGYVVIVSEMIHEARIIPTDGRPHRAEGLRSMTGESIGRWEGDTLVVDTTNYNDKGSIATASTAGRIRGIPQSEGAPRRRTLSPCGRRDDQLHRDHRGSERLHTARGPFRCRSSKTTTIASTNSPATRRTMRSPTSFVEPAWRMRQGPGNSGG